MRRVTTVWLVVFVVGCGGSAPTAPSASPPPSPPAPSQPSTETITYNGTISGGDASSCVWSGGIIQLTDAPCNTHLISVLVAGTMAASLSFNGDQGLLNLRLYDPRVGRVLVSGALNTSNFPQYAETLSTNIQPGTYQLLVSVLTISQITPYTLTVTRPK